MKTLLSLLPVAALLGCSSLTPIDDPVYLRITDMEARLLRIERVLENESLVALAGDINALRSEVQALLGQVETLQFELEGQGERSRNLYVDLDSRLQALEAAQERMASMPAAPSGVPVAAVSDQAAYDQAYGRIQQRDWEAAQTAFANFLVTYPASSLRSNAQYWMAETHFAQLSFNSALGEFQRVIDEYPQSAKVPDALLKIGYCNYELRNFDAARQVLSQVVRQFPDTAAARLAQQRLSQIAEEAG